MARTREITHAISPFLPPPCIECSYFHYCHCPIWLCHTWRQAQLKDKDFNWRTIVFVFCHIMSYKMCKMYICVKMYYFVLKCIVFVFCHIISYTMCKMYFCVKMYYFCFKMYCFCVLSYYVIQKIDSNECVMCKRYCFRLCPDWNVCTV